MDVASHDPNSNRSIQGVSSIDFSTPTNIAVDPVTHRIQIDALAGFTLPPFDYIGVTYPNTSTEVYTYKTGGSGGTLVATLTVVYSDAVTKNILLSVTRT